MGILESGSIYLHPMCWHPQEPGGSYIQSEVSQPGPMDSRTNPGAVSLLVYSIQLSSNAEVVRLSPTIL